MATAAAKAISKQVELGRAIKAAYEKFETLDESLKTKAVIQINLRQLDSRKRTTT